MKASKEAFFLPIKSYFRDVIHERYMRRCIELAQNGKGNVSPNPMVGAVVVYNNSIIGEGYHQQYGQAHAEVNAINSVKDKSLLNQSTIYVSLEPCNHFGKTPPCSDLIIENNIPRVVIGCVDPFDQVAGQGIEKLKKKGIEVTVGVLENDCIHLNRRFFTFHNKKRPYIILKWAQSQDGFIDVKRSSSSVGINWITQPETQQLTHSWRAEEDAILVGKNTVICDNPSLTVRASSGKNPIRIVLDSKLELNQNFSIFNSEAKTIIINSIKDEQVKNITYKKVNFDALEKELLSYLCEQNILSIIVEGGAYTLNQFINNNLWDEARILTGTPYFEQGLKVQGLNQIPQNTFSFGKDKITIYTNA